MLKAVAIVQRNLGRRLSAGDLGYLKHSEVWHEFLYRTIRSQPIALDWAYVENGPTTPAAVENMIADGLVPYHAPKEKPDDATTEVVRVAATPLEARRRAARATREAGYSGV